MAKPVSCNFESDGGRRRAATAIGLVREERMHKFTALFVPLALTAGLAGCGKAPEHAPPPPTVVVSTPLQMTVVDWDDYVGQFVAVDSVDVRPRVSGYLQTIGFKDGDIVKKGQVLFIIDPRPYQAVLDQAKGQEAHAEAAAQNAKIEAARGQSLLAAKAISAQANDALVATDRQAAADLLAAKANVRTASLNVEFTRVVAPLDGRVSDRRIAVGNLVTADTTVLTNIVNLNPIRFAFTGAESLFLKYERANAAGTRASSRVNATPVQIRLQDEPTYRWNGRMDFVDNALDTGSGTIRGRAVIDNPNYFLTPGMFGHMRLMGSGPYKGLLVPDQAVATDQSRQVVYVVGADDKVVQRVVQPGPLYNGLRIVRSGIGPGDRVVIDGLQRAKPGIKVTPKPGRIVAATPDNSVNQADYTPASSATIVDEAR
jgi:RND family efflux transporter MFP subunit